MASLSFSRQSQPFAAQPFRPSSSNVLSLGTLRGNNAPPPNDPLKPLRDMATRVGKEVEKFAERVDHWHTHGNENTRAKYQTTVKMVGKFRDLAESNVKELKKQNEFENQGDLNRSVRRRIQKMAEAPDSRGQNAIGQSFQTVIPSVESSVATESDSVKELRQWQAELATWELLRIIINHYHPEPGTDVAAEKRSRLAKVGGAMRYSPNTEIWDRFLLEDDQAKEKEIILRWLEQTAQNSESDIESIVAELETHSGKGTHTWTSGWLDTKSRIKQAKRMEGSEQPLQPNATVLKSNDRTLDLITQLDPDAQARQKRYLEQSDEYYERALWMVCYEMMRRGVPWKEINDWCQERNEAWRGVSIGAAYESHPSGVPNVAGETVGYLFRRMSFYAARGAAAPYEAAVYGLLSGDLKEVQPVCRSWDDHLYAHYNALLLSRFDRYLEQNHSHRVTQSLAGKFTFHDAVANMGDWNNSSRQVIKFLKQHEDTSAQATLPMKLIQSSLISQTVDELVYKVGIALAEMLQGDERLGNLMVHPESDRILPGPKPSNESRGVTVDPSHQSIASDAQALRVLVHVFITLRKGLNMFKTNMEQRIQRVAMDNVLCAYIEFLRLTKRMQLIPLYAAQLDGDRASQCLARVLPDIKNTEEQKSCVKLMESYRIDVFEVVSLSVILAFRNSGYVTIDNEGYSVLSTHITRFELLEPTVAEELSLWPGLRIKKVFSGIDIEPKEAAIIESLQWYQHLRDANTNMFSSLADALMVFLLNGRVGAAEKLVVEMSVESISLLKTEAFCGYAFDFTQPGTEEQEDDILSQSRRLSGSGRGTVRPSQIPSANEHRRIVKHLRERSALYYELQQIVRLIVLFREWREEEENIIDMRNTGTKVNTKRIKELFDTIQTVYESLVSSKPASEQADVLRLKRAYIPEIIIANLSVLQTASLFINRDATIRAMEVASTVADQDWLQDLFLKSGRMSQLVDTLAQVSKSMLTLTEHAMGKRESKKRGGKGETLKIWELTAKDRL